MGGFYPNVVPIRLSNRDLEDSELVTQKLEIPRATLIRQVWRRFLDDQIESQRPNPPAA